MSSRAKAPTGACVTLIEVISLSEQTSVWHAYFTRFLPRLLHVWLPLAALGFATDSRSRQVAMPAIGFLSLLSRLGHKEVCRFPAPALTGQWRFAIYALPLLMIAALRGEERTHVDIGYDAADSRSRVPLRRWCRSRGLPLVTLFQLGILATVLLSAASSIISHFNYPGGYAMRGLSAFASRSRGKTAHAPPLTGQISPCMSTSMPSPPCPARRSSHIRLPYASTSQRRSPRRTTMRHSMRWLRTNPSSISRAFAVCLAPRALPASAEVRRRRRIRCSIGLPVSCPSTRHSMSRSLYWSGATPLQETWYSVTGCSAQVKGDR